ncbi:MAG: hypothetical protein UZ15_CFX003000513, partial [Chloroflexi bacterium OLB15]
HGLLSTMLIEVSGFMLEHAGVPAYVDGGIRKFCAVTRPNRKSAC